MGTESADSYKHKPCVADDILLLHYQCVCSRFYQWFTNIVQGSANGTIGNTIGTSGKANGTIWSPSGTIGKPMVP